MSTFYAEDHGTKYRFQVEGGISWYGGEAFHTVRVSSKEKGERRYHYEFSQNVHCCYTAREAADHTAGNAYYIRTE